MKKPLDREAVGSWRGGRPRSLPRLRKERVHRTRVYRRPSALSGDRRGARARGVRGGRRRRPVPLGRAARVTHLPPRCDRAYRRTC